MTDSLNDFSGEPLTAVECQKIRKIVRDQERMDWFWASSRIWIGYAAAVIGTIYAAWGWIVKAFKALSS